MARVIKHRNLICCRLSPSHGYMTPIFSNSGYFPEKYRRTEKIISLNVIYLGK